MRKLFSVQLFYLREEEEVVSNPTNQARRTSTHRFSLMFPMPPFDTVFVDVRKSQSSSVVNSSRP